MLQFRRSRTHVSMPATLWSACFPAAPYLSGWASATMLPTTTRAATASSYSPPAWENGSAANLNVALTKAKSCFFREHGPERGGTPFEG
jgi:hypothetical protein